MSSIVCHKVGIVCHKVGIDDHNPELGRALEHADVCV